MQERRSNRAPLVAGDGPLARIPPIGAFVAVVVIFGVAIWLPEPFGAIVLGVLALAVAMMLLVTWEALRPVDRAIRVVALIALVSIALTQI